MHTSKTRKKAQRVSLFVLCMVTIILCMVVFPSAVGGASSKSITITAKITDQMPVAIFDASPLSGLPPLIVRFTDHSTGTGQMTYAWNFGDGGTSFVQNPPDHTYFIPGTYTVSLTVANSAGSSTASKTNYITVNPQPITLPTVTLPAGVVGSSYIQTQPFTATGGSGSFGFSVPPTTLPPGLGLSSAGIISGIPTTAGSFTFTITATDTNGLTGTQSYTIIINPQPITLPTAILPTGVVGSPYASQIISATGGNGAYSFTVTSGSLPPGLNLISSGTTGFTIEGSPTAPNTYPFTITATDTSGNGLTASQSYSITINPQPITLSPTSLPAGIGSNAYSQVITATGGSGSFSFSVPPSTLPPGLGLSSTGVISGIPTTAGSFIFTITATDTNGLTGTQSYTIPITPPSITLFPTILPAGVWNNAYTQATITASGSTLPYTYTVTSGSLPAGLSLSSAGVISGAPTVAGDFGFTVTATDANSFTGSRAYTITVNPPAITLSPTSLPAGTLNIPYTQTQPFTATGGSGPYTFSVTNGFLPTGLTLTGNTITGSPTAAGIFDFNITATDADPNHFTGSQRYTITVNPSTIILPSLPSATMGKLYSQDITPSGGTSPYTSAVTSGSLPPGLSLSANIISGIPTAVGTYSFTITAIDAASSIGLRSYSLTVDPPIITLLPASLPAGQVGTPYNQPEVFTATGGSGSYTYSVSLGALPTGLSLTGDIISGTPTVAGTFDFNITATDADPNHFTGSQRYSITINPQPVTIPSVSLPVPVVDTPYTQPIAAGGGTPPYKYTITDGTLPTGLTLNQDTGIISGTPTKTGPFTFTITVTDAKGATGSQTYTITVTAAPTQTSTGTDNGDLGGTGTSGTGTGQATGISGIAISQDLFAPPQENVIATETAAFTGISITTSPTGERVLDIAPAQTATATVSGNTVTISQPGYTLEVVVGGIITEVDGHIVGYNIESILLTTDPVDANITIGNVSAFLEAYLNSLPKGAEIKTSISLPGQMDLMKAFQEALRKEGKELDGWAYNYNVDKTNFDSCGSTNVTMTVTQKWLTDNNQTLENVHIIRMADDGSTQVLPIVSIVRNSTTGDYTITGYSRDGCSVFGLVTAKAAVVEQEQNPNATAPAGVSKAAMATNVGMYGWLMGIIEQNPWIILIVGVVVALAAYFGWWRRRL